MKDQSLYQVQKTLLDRQKPSWWGIIVYIKEEFEGTFNEIKFRNTKVLCLQLTDYHLPQNPNILKQSALLEQLDRRAYVDFETKF